ncbi:MAG: hypothetical protein ACREX4_00820 [Gammaproteobacteria bacterium]
MGFKFLARLLVFPLMVLAPPLASAVFQGAPLAAFIKFPPSPVVVATPGFSWPVFLGVAGITFLALFPFAKRSVTDSGAARTRARSHRALPWWGLLGMGTMAAAWVFAWTRFPWFDPLQGYTFTPLWLGYILLANALCYRRTARCVMLDAPLFFVALFPLSAYFWWIFEYLNQFAGNWRYVDVPEITPLERFVVSSVSFSTVLPAVLSTTQWLASFVRLQRAFTGFKPLGELQIRRFITSGLIASVVGLAMLGTHPQYAFAFLWVAPFFFALIMRRGGSDLFSTFMQGDWRPIGLPAVAALACGFFWEMWNDLSLAHWEYAVPFVQRFHLFHMPLAGYAGYLPFGAVCYLFTRLFDEKARLSSVLAPEDIHSPA